jgi:enediyne biosynthesis protein E4
LRQYSDKLAKLLLSFVPNPARKRDRYGNLIFDPLGALRCNGCFWTAHAHFTEPKWSFADWKCATTLNAQLRNVFTSRGFTTKLGKLADLVVLNDGPERDIGAFPRVHFTVRTGYTISLMPDRPQRRVWLVCAAGAALTMAAAWALPPQGMLSRGAPAAPRPKASGRVFPCSFEDVAAAAGLTAPQIDGGENKKYIVESTGSGVAFLDFDNDGWQDVFLVSGSRFEDAGGPRPANHLYRNNHDGTFTDVTAKAGLAHSGWGQSVTVADYDNDGFDDLFVTYWGRNVLYHNNGDGTFSDVSVKAGVAGAFDRWGSGAAFFDYNRDGRLDLFVANYLNLDTARTPLPGANPNCAWLGMPVICGPRGLPYSTNLLYRNNGDGTFTDVSAPSGVGTPTRSYGLGVLAADLDGDGWQDVYVACDSTPSLFYRNRGDGTFSERAVMTGLAYDDNGSEQAGMGVALGDYDRDGLLDIVKTNFIDDYPNLYRNLGKAGYQDRALPAGLGVNPQYVLWSPVFADFDNDGWPDLFFTAGHFFHEVDRLKNSPQRFRNPRLLYWNLGGGRFEDVSDRAGAGITAMHSSRGAAAGDFDNDGNLDLLVMNMNEPPSLLRNTSKSGNRWLKLKLIGTTSNRSAIGAVAKVVAGEERQTAAVLSQSGYYSHGDSRLHFGLGKAAGADRIEVLWPSGLSEEFGPADANQTLTLKEGSGRTRAR